jgi:hypothetical protein
VDVSEEHVLAELDAEQLAAVIDLYAWGHAECARIHPFANGDGRTARLWANSLAVRYGLSSFTRLRPGPNAGYGDAGAKSMQGDWKPTAVVFRRLVSDFLAESWFAHTRGVNPCLSVVQRENRKFCAMPTVLA